MSNEASKCRDSFAPYLRGRILDIGCGADKVTPEAQGWDWPQGDAQALQGLEPESFDTIFSAHCLEHLRNPQAALARWWAVLRPGGYLLLAVPEESAYEQGIWPSRLNNDHKATFTTSQDVSWSPASYNLTDLIKPLPHHMLVRLERVVTPIEPAPEGMLLDPTEGEGLAQVELVLAKTYGPMKLRSELAQVFACPQCRREVIAIGTTPEGKLQCRCNRCGVTGTYNLG